MLKVLSSTEVEGAHHIEVEELGDDDDTIVRVLIRDIIDKELKHSQNETGRKLNQMD